MAEPRHYEALAASQLCADGAFKVCGYNLAPFSFRHCIQLEALENPIWTRVRSSQFDDLHAAAAVCSTRDFVLSPQPIESRAFDYEREASTWAEYIRVCYGTRPRVRVPINDCESVQAGVPFEEFIASYIMRKTSGFTREWIFTAPVAEVLWIYASISEQETGRVQVISEDEYRQIVKESSPEARLAAENRCKIAAEIFRLVPHARERLPLLAKLDTGKLPKDWKTRLTKPKQRKTNGRRA